jgi:hypothetical protein
MVLVGNNEHDDGGDDDKDPKDPIMLDAGTNEAVIIMFFL